MSTKTSHRRSAARFIQKMTKRDDSEEQQDRVQDQVALEGAFWREHKDEGFRPNHRQ